MWAEMSLTSTSSHSRKTFRKSHLLCQSEPNKLKTQAIESKRLRLRVNCFIIKRKEPVLREVFHK